MSEGKRNIITSLIQEYDIKAAEGIQDALKALLGGIIISAIFYVLYLCYTINKQKVLIDDMI